MNSIVTGAAGLGLLLLLIGLASSRIGLPRFVFALAIALLAGAALGI